MTLFRGSDPVFSRRSDSDPGKTHPHPQPCKYPDCPKVRIRIMDMNIMIKQEYLKYLDFFTIFKITQQSDLTKSDHVLNMPHIKICWYLPDSFGKPTSAYNRIYRLKGKQFLKFLHKNYFGANFASLSSAHFFILFYAIRIAFNISPLI